MARIFCAAAVYIHQAANIDSLQTGQKLITDLLYLLEYLLSSMGIKGSAPRISGTKLGL